MVSPVTLSGRCRARGLLAAWLLAGGLLAGCALPGPSGAPDVAPSASPSAAGLPDDRPTDRGGVEDRTPTVSVLSPDPEPTELFTARFTAQPNERFLVRSILAVSSATARLFIGQTLSCVGPDAARVDGLEVGRNVDPSVEVGTQVRGFFVVAPTAEGQWTCRTLVRVAEPGASGLLHRIVRGLTGLFRPQVSPTLTLLTAQDTPVRYSQLRVSAPLPEWAQEARPTSGPVPVQSGSSATLSTDVTGIPLSVGRVEFTGIVSVTTCIEETYPDACAQVTQRSKRGSSTLLPSFTVTQYGPGLSCIRRTATASEGAAQQVLTWEEHHGILTFTLPEVRPSSEPGCEGRFRVDVTITVLDGNGVVLEPGVARRPRSLILALPSATL